LKHSVEQLPEHGYFDSMQSRTALHLASSDVLSLLQALHITVPQAYPLLMILLMQLPPSGNPASVRVVPLAPPLATAPSAPTAPPAPVEASEVPPAGGAQAAPWEAIT